MVVFMAIAIMAIACHLPLMQERFLPLVKQGDGLPLEALRFCDCVQQDCEGPSNLEWQMRMLNGMRNKQVHSQYNCRSSRQRRLATKAVNLATSNVCPFAM